MKTLILSISLIILGTTVSFAQCDKKVKFISSKTDHVDSKGTITRTEIEDAVLQIGKTFVAITVSGESKGIFTIKSMTCDWKVPFKEGKTTINASMDDLNVTLTFEGKEGKVTGQFVANGREDDIIRVTADKFEEDI